MLSHCTCCGRPVKHDGMCLRVWEGGEGTSVLDSLSLSLNASDCLFLSLCATHDDIIKIPLTYCASMGGNGCWVTHTHTHPHNSGSTVTHRFSISITQILLLKG